MKKKDGIPLLKEFIKMTIQEPKAGAGIIIVREFSGTFKVLGLTSLEGKLDIPKGTIDPGEFPLEAALRETKEESGIVDLEFSWGFDHIVNGQLTCYLAKTSQDPFISKNPKTGIIEHTAASWVSWEDLMLNTFDYIIPCIKWAQKTVGLEE